MKKISVWFIAFITMLVVFFTAGVLTLGTTKQTGNGLYYKTDTTVCYNVDLATGDAFNAVYLHVGDIREQTTLTVRYSTSSSSTSFKKFAELTIDERSGAYRFITVGENKKLEGVQRVSITATGDFRLNEIVCLNLAGNPLGLHANTSVSDYESYELERALDAQNSLTLKTSRYDTFTVEESKTLGAVNNVLAGKAFAGGASYPWINGYNHLSTLAFAGSVALFGSSPFALRLPALIASALALVFAFFLLRAVTKSDLIAFFSVALFAVGGAVFSLSHVGSAGALICSALLASAYFAYRFFANGIRSTRVKRDALTLLYSGIFGAIALALDFLSIVALVGVAVILAFGWRRQYIAYQRAKEQPSANARTERAIYRYKTRVSVCFTLLSFVCVFFFLQLSATSLVYPALARTYDLDFGGAMLKGLSLSFLPASTGVTNAFSWWLGVTAPTEYLVFSILCLIAFLGVWSAVVYTLVKKMQDKEVLRLRRSAYLLTGGMFASLLAGLIKPVLISGYFGVFATLYATFAVLAIRIVISLCRKEQAV